MRRKQDVFADCANEKMKKNEWNKSGSPASQMEHNRNVACLENQWMLHACVKENINREFFVRQAAMLDVGSKCIGKYTATHFEWHSSRGVILVSGLPSCGWRP